MKRKVLSNATATLVMLMLLQSPAFSQKQYQLSVKEAVELALKQVNEIRNLEVDKKLQIAKNREITGQALPQINGTVNANHYFSIPVTFLPDFISPTIYDVLVKEGVNGSTGPVTKPSNNNELFPARFGVPWQASAGFSIQQLLFQPDVFVGLQARDKALEFADYNIKVMEDSIRTNVYRAYYSVLIAQKRRALLETTVTRLETLLHDQTEMYKNGFAEKLDLDKTQVSLNNLRTSMNQAQNLVVIGNAALKFSTGMNQKDSLLLTDTLSMEKVKADLLETDFRYEDRNEIKLLNSLVELQNLNVKRYKLGRIPTISAFYNYSQNAQRQTFSFFSSKESWYTTSVVGFNLSVPIFTGLQQNRKIEQAELTVEKTRNNIQNLKQAIDLQIVSQLQVLKNALANLDIQTRNMELSAQVYNSTKIKFEQGLGSSFEILQSVSSFDESQQNYFQALFEAVVARISYLRTLGKL
ncbi:MAG TPA: TolC family protein [Flavitalea sp.]|nr:TolC family protein [Flavitalea sp.]